MVSDMPCPASGIEKHRIAVEIAARTGECGEELPAADVLYLAMKVRDRPFDQAISFAAFLMSAWRSAMVSASA